MFRSLSHVYEVCLYWGMEEKEGFDFICSGCDDLRRVSSLREPISVLSLSLMDILPLCNHR